MLERQDSEQCLYCPCRPQEVPGVAFGAADQQWGRGARVQPGPGTEDGGDGLLLGVIPLRSGGGVRIDVDNLNGVPVPLLAPQVPIQGGMQERVGERFPVPRPKHQLLLPCFNPCPYPCFYRFLKHG